MGNSNTNATKTLEQPEQNALDGISPVISDLQKCFEKHNDIVMKLDKFVHDEKNAVEKLKSQNLEAIKIQTNREENTDRVPTDGLDLVSDITEKLVSTNKALKKGYTLLKTNVLRVIKSVIDASLLDQFESKYPGRIKALSDIGECCSNEPSKVHTQSTAMTVQESNRKADVQDPIESDQHKQDVDVNGYNCIAERLLECINEHDDNLKTIRSTMNVQESAMDQQPPKELQLQLYHQRDDEVMKVVVRELESKLKCLMESVSISIDVIQCSNASKIKQGIPVRVLRIAVFRNGTDMDSALAEIKSKMNLTNEEKSADGKHVDGLEMITIGKLTCGDIPQRNAKVDPESVDKEAPSGTPLHESDRKADVQGMTESDQRKQNVEECLHEHYDNFKFIGRTMFIQNSSMDEHLQHESVTGQNNNEGFPRKRSAKHSFVSVHDGERIKFKGACPGTEASRIAIKLDTLSDEDWKLIINNYAHLKECVHDLVANTIDTNRQAAIDLKRLIGSSNSKGKADFSEPYIRQTTEDDTSSDPNSLQDTDKKAAKSNESLEKQDAIQNRYRKTVRTLKVPCVHELLVQLKQAETENNTLKERIDETEENDKYKMKKERQTKRLVPLQLYYKHNEYLTESDVNTLNAFLTSRMESYDVDIKVVQCTDAMKIKESIPVLVVCTYTKGHSFKADTALAGIKRTKHTALLIFHPMDGQVPRKRKGEVIESELGGIFDIAFLQDKDKRDYLFYEKALGNVCKFIMEHMPVQLQLYHKRNDELMKTVVKELVLKLKCEMESVGVDINVMECTNASKLNPDIPVLVLCIDTSIVVADVENASTEIKLTKQTALVVFHYKDKHVKIMRTRDRVTGKDLGGIFDIAFLQNKGIYACDLNTNALENLRDFIAKTRG